MKPIHGPSSPKGHASCVEPPVHGLGWPGCAEAEHVMGREENCSFKLTRKKRFRPRLGPGCSVGHSANPTRLQLPLERLRATRSSLAVGHALLMSAIQLTSRPLQLPCQLNS